MQQNSSNSRWLPAACLIFLRTRTWAALGSYQRVQTSSSITQQDQAAVAMGALALTHQHPSGAQPGQIGTFAGEVVGTHA